MSRRMVPISKPFISFYSEAGVIYSKEVLKESFTSSEFIELYPRFMKKNGKVKNITSGYYIDIDTVEPKQLKVSSIDKLVIGENDYGGLFILFYDIEGKLVKTEYTYDDFTKLTFSVSASSVLCGIELYKQS